MCLPPSYLGDFSFRAVTANLRQSFTRRANFKPHGDLRPLRLPLSPAVRQVYCVIPRARFSQALIPRAGSPADGQGGSLSWFFPFPTCCRSLFDGQATSCVEESESRKASRQRQGPQGEAAEVQDVIERLEVRRRESGLILQGAMASRDWPVWVRALAGFPPIALSFRQGVARIVAAMA